MPRIYISFRRDERSPVAGHLYRMLSARFGEGQVLTDIDTIPPRLDFEQALDQRVASCDVVLAIIGRRWGLDAQAGALHEFVHLEIGTAFRKGIPVIPVLVEGARIPEPESLCPELVKLAELTGLSASELSLPELEARLMAVVGATRPRQIDEPKDQLREMEVRHKMEAQRLRRLFEQGEVNRRAELKEDLLHQAAAKPNTKDGRETGPKLELEMRQKLLNQAETRRKEDSRWTARAVEEAQRATEVQHRIQREAASRREDEARRDLEERLRREAAMSRYTEERQRVERDAGVRRQAELRQMSDRDAEYRREAEEKLRREAEQRRQAEERQRLQQQIEAARKAAEHQLSSRIRQ